jgi:hypothetical protein
VIYVYYLVAVEDHHHDAMEDEVKVFTLFLSRVKGLELNLAL